MFADHLFTTSYDENEKKRSALLQSILERHKEPYVQRAEEIKRNYPQQMQSEHLRELNQKMVSDPMIKGIADQIAEELLQKGVVFVGVYTDGSISCHTKDEVFK